MEFHKASAPEPSGTSQGICTRTLRNLTKHLLRQNPPKPQKASAPEPSGTSQGICTRTLRNLTKHLLRQNPPKPQKASAPEPSGTSQGICPGALRNLTTHLHLDPLEPHQVAAPETSGTLRRHLHRNPPEPYGTFFGKNAEAFKLLGLAPEFILNKRDDVLSWGTWDRLKFHWSLVFHVEGWVNFWEMTTHNNHLFWCLPTYFITTSRLPQAFECDRCI